MQSCNEAPLPPFRGVCFLVWVVAASKSCLWCRLLKESPQSMSPWLLQSNDGSVPPACHLFGAH